MWFEATKVGQYHLFCAEYCGTQHSGMIGTVYVMEPEDYQRWLTSTYQGAVSREHLDYYLDEYTFRFNRRGVREHAFLTLLLLAAKRGPAGIPHARQALAQGQSSA